MTASTRCPVCGTKLDQTDNACRNCGASQTNTATVITGETPSGVTTQGSELQKELSEALAPNYLLIKKLGEGGMGSVFLARDASLKRLVAVKVLLPEIAAIEKARKRFQREAESVAAITHPNVIAIYGVGNLSDGTPYFVMQYVDGKDLGGILEEDGVLDTPAASKILKAVASGLAAVHKSGIVHRDIKPANILLDETGGVFVSDFGIAAIDETRREQSSAKLTGVGVPMGTPTYMSPEQLTANEITTATDVYSLGAMGFEMVAGRSPFIGDNVPELIAAKLRDPVPKLSKIRRSVTREYEEIVTRCLATEPSMRPTAVDVTDHLCRCVTSDLRTKWLGTALLIGVAALAWVTLLLFGLVEALKNFVEAIPTAGEMWHPEFARGLDFSVVVLIFPMGLMTAFFLVLTILSLIVHLVRLGLRHRNFLKMVSSGFALPGLWGAFSIGLGAIILVSVPLIVIMPIIQSMPGSVDLVLPLSLRVPIMISESFQTWWGLVAIAGILVAFARGRLPLTRRSRSVGIILCSISFVA